MSREQGSDMVGFVPGWADEALRKPQPFDVGELQVLREFYAAWYDYHTIPNDKAHKTKQRAAADLMLERHNVLQNMKSPKLGTLTLNGVKCG